MNKKFYFALALTAGLFASCSSDDIAQAPGLQGSEGNGGDAIQLTVNNAKGTTRGTGTVGNTTANTNQWDGQTINVLMLDKGYLDVAEDGNHNPIYGSLNAGEELTVEANGQAAVILDITADGQNANWTDRTVESRYFPTSGVFDFWGYRVDDAATGNNIAGLNVSGTQATGQATLDFTIDGSQDIMVAKAEPTLNANNKIDGIYGGVAQEVDPAKAYSAYTARRNIQPEMTFKHLLSRFSFQVKGASAADCVDAAITDEAVISKTGLKVDAITVTAKNTGTLVVAYTAAQEPERITWNAATAPLVLKQREKAVDVPETGIFRYIKVVKTANGFDFEDETGGPLIAVRDFNNNIVNINDAMPVYDSDATYVATTNKPSGNATTIGDVKNSLQNAGDEAEVYYYGIGTAATYLAGTPDVTANLVALDPVTPTCSGATMNPVPVGEALLLPADVNSYDVVLTVRQYVTTSTTNVFDANNNPVYTDNVDQPTKYWVKVPAVPAGDATYTEENSDATAYAAAANATDITGANPTYSSVQEYANTLAANDVAYVKTGDATYVKITITAAATAPVAEYYQELDGNFTARANQVTSAAFTTGQGNGTYVELVRKNGGFVQSDIHHQIHLAQNPTSGQYANFEAGKSYNVVFTISGTQATSITQPGADNWEDHGTDLEFGDDDEI